MILATILLCGQWAYPSCDAAHHVGFHYVPGKHASYQACFAAAMQHIIITGIQGRYKIICGPAQPRLERAA